MEILGETIERELPDLARQGVRTRFFGRRDRAPGDLRERMGELERSTAGLDTLALWIAFDYGGRAELVEAARPLRRGRPRCRRRGRGALSARLYAPELPEIDLLIRTSGEFRISNFMLWETAYAEFVFTDTLWPDFGADDLRAALDAFSARATGGSAAGEPVLVADRRRAGAAASRPRDRLARRLVALRRRARRRADGPARALRHGARPAAARPRRLRRSAADAPRSELGETTWMVGGHLRDRPRGVRRVRLLGRAPVRHRCDLADAARRRLGRRRPRHADAAARDPGERPARRSSRF